MDASDYPPPLVEYIGLAYPFAYKVQYLASTSEYGAYLHTDLRFARFHILRELQSAKLDIGAFLAAPSLSGLDDPDGDDNAKWIALPLNYKAAIYAEILLLAKSELHIDAFYQAGVLINNWPLSKDEAAFTVNALSSEPEFKIIPITNAAVPSTAITSAAKPKPKIINPININRQKLLLIACIFSSLEAVLFLTTNSQPSNKRATATNKLFAQWEATSSETSAATNNSHSQQIDVSSSGANYALIYAAEQGAADIVAFLLGSRTKSVGGGPTVNTGVNPKVEFNYPLQTACMRGHADVVRLLLEHKFVDPTFFGGSLRGAAGLKKIFQQQQVNDTVVLKVGSDGGGDGDAAVAAADNPSPATLIIAAAIRGHVEVVKVLVEDGRVDPTAEDNEAICVAAENGFFDVVQFLMSVNGVNPAAQNQRAILGAAKNKHLGIVQLLSKDARVDAELARHA
ncbi:hypothetical protein HK100_009316 [Physocladia obscura]|uniref:Ankyrin n=1 Tax=Physocladia obscura TaxID=109957 RepID=A0AAD5XI17_9FUNG|nr:hypothetical protein HK100_009316 [Physocladia obscura]